MEGVETETTAEKEEENETLPEKEGEEDQRQTDEVSDSAYDLL